MTLRLATLRTSQTPSSSSQRVFSSHVGAIAVEDRGAETRHLIERRGLPLRHKGPLAELDTQRRAVATETSNAAIAGNQVLRARASLELTSNTVDPLEPLLGKGYVSVQQVDDARTAKRKAATGYSQAVEQARASKNAIGNLDRALASVELRRSSLALAERDLSKTVVPAPHD